MITKKLQIINNKLLQSYSNNQEIKKSQATN